MRALHLIAAVSLSLACSSPSREEPPGEDGSLQFAAARDAMVKTQLEGRDVTDRRVLAAMRTVPRHEFVPARYRLRAYGDHPLPIGHGQTISQPYVVAIMSQLAELGPQAKVLEIGTGSGYQAAILAELAAEVYSIEIVEPLASQATRTLRRLGYAKVEVRAGDGYQGWPERAPFDAIIVTAAPPEVPEPLLAQLREGGRLVIPVGDYFQELKVITRRGDRYPQRSVFPVRFVPMTGEAQAPRGRDAAAP